VAYGRSDVGREFAALIAVPVTAGAATVLAERDGCELQDLVLSPDGRMLVLLWNVDGGRSVLTALDLADGEQREVGPLPRDVVDDCRISADGMCLLLTAESWADRRGVWSLNLASGVGSAVSSSGHGQLRSSRGASTPNIDTHAAPSLRQLRGRDGLPISGCLYPAPGPPPWPMMIHLHGGPEAQERPVYNSLFQSLVAAGVAVFATFHERTEPWIAAAAVSEYGDPQRDAELLRRLSPIHRIDRLRAPLLVVHGDEDTNVPVHEAEQVVAALTDRGVEHRYLLFRGEGHELLDTANRVAFVQATVAWVTRHLDVPADALSGPHAGTA